MEQRSLLIWWRSWLFTHPLSQSELRSFHWFSNILYSLDNMVFMSEDFLFLFVTSLTTTTTCDPRGWGVLFCQKSEMYSCMFAVRVGTFEPAYDFCFDYRRWCGGIYLYVYWFLFTDVWKRSCRHPFSNHLLFEYGRLLSYPNSMCQHIVFIWHNIIFISFARGCQHPPLLKPPSFPHPWSPYDQNFKPVFSIFTVCSKRQICIRTGFTTRSFPTGCSV